MKNYLLAILFIFTSSSLFAMSKKAPRQPIKLKKDDQHKFSGKSMGYFSANITKIDNGNGDITFKAQVLPRNDMMSAQYQWKLPETVKILSGETQDTVDYKKNDVKTFEITIDKESIKNEDKIFFFAFKVQNGERYGTSVTHLYKSSDTQQEIKAQSKSMDKKKNPKIFQ